MQLLLPETSISMKEREKGAKNQMLSLETPGAGQEIAKAYQGNRCQGRRAEWQRTLAGERSTLGLSCSEVPLRLVAFHARNLSFHLFGIS